MVGVETHHAERPLRRSRRDGAEHREACRAAAHPPLIASAAPTGERRVPTVVNVAEGIYFAETQVRERVVASRPTVCIQVRGGPGFGGLVQMNPTMRVVPSAARAGAAS